MSMASAEEQQEAELAEKLAQLRWGPTGFCCPFCDHELAYRLRGRPRVRECRQCRRQISVTSGTLMHRTRLPLAHWFEQGEFMQSHARIRTSSEVVARLNVARSTAWLLTQKLLYAMTVDRSGMGPFCMFQVPVRRPMPGRPLGPGAPAHLREAHAQHLAGRIRSLRISSAVQMIGPYARLEALGLTPEQERFYLRAKGPLPDFSAKWLRHWLTYALRGQHKTVSLRWLPRWLGAILSWWERRPSDLPWIRAVLTVRPRPLAQLDPWLAL
jgi:transposase-like protein